MVIAHVGTHPDQRFGWLSEYRKGDLQTNRVLWGTCIRGETSRTRQRRNRRAVARQLETVLATKTSRDAPK